MAKNIDLDAIDFYNITVESAFHFFTINARLVTDLATLQRVVYEIIEDYEKQNTRYLELRTNFKAFGDKTKLDYLNAILEVFENAEQNMPNIKVRLLASLSRNGTLQDAQETLEVVRENMNSPYIVGIEISGDPRSGDFGIFNELMQNFKAETGLKVALHCAEAAEQAHESQAMIDFNPDRLGHCVYLVSTSTRIFLLLIS